MKKILIILILLLSILSCTTPEEKIIDSFKEGRMHRYNKEIKSAEIYDTIYTQDALDSFPYFEEKISYLNNKIRKMDNFRDSIVKLNYPDSLRRTLLMQGFRIRESLERDEDHVRRQLGYYFTFYNYSDSICGYFVKVYTEKDTFDFVVESKNYQIITPTFMFKNQPPSKLRRNFN